MQNKTHETVQRIVEMVTQTNLLMNNRKRECVDARMIYSYVLRHTLGASLTSIGMSINKDHTTIIHYLKTMESLLEVDREVARKYIRCKELLLLSEQPLNLLDERDEILEINRLKEQVEILERKNKLLEEDNNRIAKQIGRFMNILELIEENTPSGEEYFVERKIKKMFNE